MEPVANNFLAIVITVCEAEFKSVNNPSKSDNLGAATILVEAKPSTVEVIAKKRNAGSALVEDSHK